MKTFLLILHIVSGYICLTSGIAAMIVAKGKSKHRLFGRIFAYSVFTTGISSIFMALIYPNKILLLIGFFVLYQAVNGYLAVKQRGIVLGWHTVILFFGGCFTGVSMLLTFNPILLAFGMIQLVLVFMDTRVHWLIFRNKNIPKNTHLTRHIGQMTGAYIGVFTAFLVVNIHLEGALLQLLFWLGPTLLFTPFMVYHLRKINKPLKTAVVIALFLGTVNQIWAQSYLEKQSRHRFAQSYLGVSTEGYSLGNQQVANIQIGGLHFWGKADFCIDIPIVSRSQFGLQPGVKTSAMYYPFRLKNNSLRPYLGIAWQLNSYQLEGAPMVTKHQIPLMAGLCYALPKWMFGLTVSRTFAEPLHYAEVPFASKSIDFEHWSVGISAKYLVDFTLSAEKDWESGRTALVTKKLASLGKLNSWTASVGASSSFYVNPSPRWQKTVPLPFPINTSILGDVGLGYYGHRSDMQWQIIYRKFHTEQQGYGQFFETNRHSLGLEGSKFFWDYHGFVPFVGAGVTWNSSKIASSYSDIHNLQENKVLGHLLFGWDIRPNRLQYVYLRTNLRYNFVPKSTMQIPISTWEINFIQAVFLINRFFM